MMPRHSDDYGDLVDVYADAAMLSDDIDAEDAHDDAVLARALARYEQHESDPWLVIDAACRDVRGDLLARLRAGGTK